MKLTQCQERALQPCQWHIAITTAHHFAEFTQKKALRPIFWFALEQA
jgi:hypothetical protein